MMYINFNNFHRENTSEGNSRPEQGLHNFRSTPNNLFFSYLEPSNT